MGPALVDDHVTNRDMLYWHQMYNLLTQKYTGMVLVWCQGMLLECVNCLPVSTYTA